MSKQAPFSSYREAGDLIFFSGQIEATPEQNILEGTIAEKTDQAMKNVKALLDEVGLTFSDVVSTTIYLTDINQYAEMNNAYTKWFDDVFPTRAAFAVKELPLGAKIEIVVVASKKNMSTMSSLTYGPSKAAVIAMTKALAKTYSPKGIRFNAVMPGYIRTDVSEDWPKETWDRINSGILLGIIGEPNEVAELVMFLASDKASYITGSEILIDGGYTLKGK